MNELLAIIAIVIICCLMFFAWLLSMAICPDAMVNLLSGRRERYCNSTDSKELIARCEEANISHDFLKNVVSAEKMSEKVQPLSARRSSDKKLSVVPEADEQSTVQSTVHSIRPTILRPIIPPSKLEEEEKENE